VGEVNKKIYKIFREPQVSTIKLISLILLFVLPVISVFCIYKEINAETKAEEHTAKGKALEVAQYPRGKLYFGIYWLGIYAGKAVLEATNDNGTLRITSRVYSAPLISIFYKVEDYAECLIKDGMPLNFRIKQHEGRYRSDKETKFDYAKGKLIYFDYLKGKKKKHIIKEGVVWDVISGFYYLMAQPLEVGEVIYIDIFDSNKFYKAEVKVLKKEKVDMLDRGKVDTVVVKPKLKSGGLFKSKGDILVWLTDDEEKIPVRIETKVPIGKVVVKLKNIEEK